MKRLATSLACPLVLSVALWAAGPAERKVVYHENPDYPAVAAGMNLHGTVKVKVWINSDGSVRRVEYIGGHPLLAQAAIIAVKNWRYELGAKETTSQVEVKF
jgi:TonB family protein